MINVNSKKMLWRLFFGTIVFYSQSLMAQSYSRTLNWNEQPKEYFIYNQTMVKQITFSNAATDETNAFLPIYSEQIPLLTNGTVAASLTDAVYEPVILPYTEKINLSHQINIQSTVTETRGKYSAAISFIPVRKSNTGQYERLKSFTLVLNFSPIYTINSRATSGYAGNSVLATGTWYKVAVTNTGIHKLDYAYFKQTLNVAIDNIPFDKIGVFGNGGGMIPEKNNSFRYDDLQENAIYKVDNNGNNKFDADDYILFFAEGPNKVKYNPTSNLLEHEYNLYEDKNYYFITTDKGTNKRISSALPAASPNNFVSDFDDFAFHESDEYNLLESGRFWFGDRMNYANTLKSFSFDFPNLVTSVPVTYRTGVLAISEYQSTISFAINGSQLFSRSFSSIPMGGYRTGYIYYGTTGTTTVGSNTVNTSFTFSNPDQSTDTRGFIDYISIQARRALIMENDQMIIRNINSIGNGKVTQFSLANINSNIKIFRLTDLISIQEINTNSSGSSLSFIHNTDSMETFCAVNIKGSFPAPENKGAIENQDLHATPFVDNVIVTNDEMYPQALELAAFHNGRGVSSTVVKINQLYNEFSSGRQDISAIRDFMRMLYVKANNDSLLMPKYLCLFGDGSYDYKNRIGSNTNLVPTFESYNSYDPLSSYVTDDYFGFLSNNEGGDITNFQTLDIGVGRLPAANSTEAAQMVSKIKHYKSPASLGAWRNMIATIGDDEDGGVHQKEADYLAEYVRINYPDYNEDKIILDAYQQVSTPGGSRYPDVNLAIANRLANGTLLLSYTGHGGVNNWAHERIFNITDIQALRNKDRLPLFVTATCDFSPFDNPAKRSAGEYVITNPDGGGIASITTVRAVFSSANDDLQNALFSKLFINNMGKKPTMGTLLSLAKNNIGGDVTNARKFVLLGDPALQLNYPEYNIVTTQINNQPLGGNVDTFKALKLMTVSGEVRDWVGNKLTNFNGTCNIIVFDKLATFKNLQNESTTPLRTFNAYKNTLFKGQATVVNGNFAFSFIVPKDINYLVGDGRISYYASDPTQNTDAQGYNNNIKVGLAADTFLTDNEGPEIDIYMNNEKFVYGGITNSSPKLLVKLRDESGVNTSGNGFGHDVMAVLDKNQQKPYILNDYYEAEKDSFTTGKILYPLSKISEGRHTITAKAWDVQNNSAEATTEFIVANDAKVALSNVFNYPNPFTTSTSFMFEHNRPGDNLSILIQIYTNTGRLVKSIQREIASDGFRVNDIKWDGLDDYGDKIGKGVYIYKVAVKDSQGNAAYKFQKLVLLR